MADTPLQQCLYDFGEVFAGKKSGITVPGFMPPAHPLVPEYKSGYAYPEWARDVFSWFIHSTEPLFISGPTGCGKSSLVRQIASRLLYPVYEVTGHARLETPDLVGHFALHEGSTVWKDGPLTAAMRNGGILLLDEVDLLDPSTATGLNTVLDGAPLCIAETAEVVKPHPGFRFIATANTFGSGDDSGLYQGTLRLNAAFMDRFVCVEADYLPEPVEADLIAKLCPDLPHDVRKGIVRFASLVRGLHKRDDSTLEALTKVSGAEALNLPLSTRSLLRWARWVTVSKPLAKAGINPTKHALYRAFGFRCDTMGRRVLDELLQRAFGETAKNKED